MNGDRLILDLTFQTVTPPPPPVPEPVSAALLFSGLAGLAAVRLRGRPRA